MKKKILSATFVVAMMAVAGYNVYAEQANNKKANMILANVEALASDGEFNLKLYPQRETDQLSSSTTLDSTGITTIIVEKVTCPRIAVIEETCEAGIDTLRFFMPR